MCKRVWYYLQYSCGHWGPDPEHLERASGVEAVKVYSCEQRDCRESKKHRCPKGACGCKPAAWLWTSDTSNHCCPQCRRRVRGGWPAKPISGPRSGLMIPKAARLDSRLAIALDEVVQLLRFPGSLDTNAQVVASACEVHCHHQRWRKSVRQWLILYERLETIRTTWNMPQNDLDTARAGLKKGNMIEIVLVPERAEQPLAPGAKRRLVQWMVDSLEDVGVLHKCTGHQHLEGLATIHMLTAVDDEAVVEFRPLNLDVKTK